MRRGLIAIFALHFLVNVVFFAFGKIETAKAWQPAEVAASLLEPSEPAHEDDLLGHAHDHGLTDTQPELPEWLHLNLGPFTSACDVAPPVAALRHPAASPPLEGLQRPPRASAQA